MRYFIVPRIGTGTATDPYRPDVPAGTPCVGQTDGVDFLIATPVALPLTEHLPEPPLRAAAEAMGLVYESVLKWNVN